MARRRFCSQSGDGPFLTPRMRRRPKAGQSDGVSPKSRRTSTGQGKRPFDRRDRTLDQPAEAGGGEIAGDAGNAERIRPVRRDVDVDAPHRRGRHRAHRAADRGVLRQVDDAVMAVGKAELALRQQHAVRFDAADDALLEVDAGARDMRAGRREDAMHAGPCIRRAADDLHRRSLAGVDHADAQPIGVRMLLRRKNLHDPERRKGRRPVLDAFDLEADDVELADDGVERRLRIEMLLQPGEGELHYFSSSAV